MSKPRLLLAFALVAVAAFALASQDFSVARKPRAGDLLRYRMEADTTVSGQRVKFVGTIQERILEVRPDGAYVIERTQTDGSIEVAGERIVMPPQNPTRTVRGAAGELLDIEGTMVGPQSFRMEHLGSILPPTRNVRIGDSWTHEIRSDVRAGGIAARAEYTVLEEERLEGWDTLKIRATVRETSGDRPAAVESTIWIDRADGTMVRSESNWTNAPFPGTVVPAAATVTMMRLPN
jgi:hypothetical protein